MRVNPYPSGVSGTQRTEPARSGERSQKTEAKAPAKSDKVTLSAKAREAVAFRARLSSSPEVRMELVDRLKQEIESGRYQVDTKRVADALLRSNILS